MAKIILKAELDVVVLEKLREILRNHQIEWEVNIIVPERKESDKRLVENREGSYEI